MSHATTLGKPAAGLAARSDSWRRPLSMRAVLISIALTLLPEALLAADFNLGMDAYERRDYTAAAREFVALADAGDPYAQYLLGRLYSQGNGVARDAVQAHKWYSLAAGRGHEHAARARDTLARQMRKRDIQQAKGLANQWRPGTHDTTAHTPVAAWPTSVRDVNAAIQKSLNDLGYDAGPADGVMGGKTRAAIRDYQADRGMRVDGQPSESLLQHLTTTQGTAGTATASSFVAVDSRWPRLVLHDAFQDGDYTRNPVWSVSAGQFAIEPGIGLRTTYQPRLPAPEARLEDLPIAILSAILGQSTRTAGSEIQAVAADFAEIHADGSISNAFASQLDLTLRQAPTGPLAFGPYQGTDRSGGYRLVYTPNVERGLHLVRMTSTGSSVIESVDPRFSLNRPYSIRWTRDLSGVMRVSLDGNELFQVTDRSLADPFTGFTLLNRGGDYAIKQVTIHGVN